ncbi:MAG: ribose-phosphate pyrophosphokinase [Deltaproteobacteria bacterium]|nr:ribose-phosphate pyrophosphokinase [Deltaproteobacteria bacterium]MBI3079154.1 ribose-phosphate pyrophosphokinase [Deltaproteobacteria bacterium]
MQRLSIFTGTANPALAEEIAEHLGISLGQVEVGRFSDGEVRVQINENVRGTDAFIIQPTPPPAENLIELLLMIDALRRASADRITAVIPYFGYARQDRKDKPRVAIAAKLVANLIATAGANRVLAMDLHAGQIQGFFDIPVDNLFAAPVFLEDLRTRAQNDLVMVAPDAGGVERARAFAKRLDCTLAIIDKRRPAPNVAEVMNVIGEVDGMVAVIVDDIVDTAGTLTLAAPALIKAGARKVLGYCTHPVLSGPALDTIAKSEIQELVVTNTIPLRPAAQACPKIRVLSVAGLLGEAIWRTHVGDSVSSLFV